ncbi:RDD family protein [Cellulomonas sp. PhB143]|uniref:RDD family protein n=1 Tax=Cellulomonas sp. PhB143 TaxID=2485186 RepID=UPI000F492BD2|nr:RDD family protein [Cellulomonas sp. PhB143]ROS78526.1 putative RDD family membrane protein YckC [Cellulomonas sp. PhB143]
MRDGILTGEGVVLDARTASFLTRALAVALDLTALWFLAVAVLLVLDAWPPPEEYTIPVTLGAVVLLLVGVPTAVEALTRGRSLGKLAAGIRVVRDDGGPVRLRHAFVRALVGTVEIVATLGCIALIASLSNDRGKRLGDMLAGTYVVRVRGARGGSAPVVMPPWLAAWAAQADMRRLPDGLALDARRFLGRAPRLNPDSRARLGTEIAARVESYVAPGPPPGTPPEVFVTAVLAERRTREHVREAAAQELVRREAATVRRLPHDVPDPRR